MTSPRAPGQTSPDADPYVARELAAHGFVRPPWLYDEDEHPLSAAWRMGGGESQVMAFGRWWRGLGPGEEERVAWVRRWEPPALWWPWAAGLIWPELRGESDRMTAVARLAAIGIGSVGEWMAAEQRAMDELDAEIARREAEPEQTAGRAGGPDETD